MSDLSAQHRKLRARKWISLVVRRCSYTRATERVLQSMHYARSVISRSGAALRRHHSILFNLDMNPKRFLFENHPAKILHSAPRHILSLCLAPTPVVVETDFAAGIVYFVFCL